jgi:aryl-alcohol dehydrogenase-like predicted oxidoreductase
MELRGANSGRGRAIRAEEADAILNAVLNSGINYIDTSIDYGISEELIGRFISHRRSEYYLASKCGCHVGPVDPSQPRPPHIFTRENIVVGVNQSLARMKTDYIDVMQFHASPSKAELEENDAIQTLLDLQREGKIRFIASSSILPNLVDHIAMGVFDAFQIPYSALQREHETAISQAAEAGAGTIIRGGVARGAVSEDNRRDHIWSVWERAKLDDLLGDMTRMEFMLRFTLTHPDLHTTIVGTRNPEHLRDNVRAAEKGPLPADVYEEAKRRLEEAGEVPQPV